MALGRARSRIRSLDRCLQHIDSYDGETATAAFRQGFVDHRDRIIAAAVAVKAKPTEWNIAKLRREATP